MNENAAPTWRKDPSATSERLLHVQHGALCRLVDFMKATLSPAEQELSHPLNNAADSLYMHSLLVLHAPFPAQAHAHRRCFGRFSSELLGF